ncbi:MAG: prepilin-type N-terminal cleavage/methylation domain-containing protein [Patescibacteria group bacterium]
MKKLKQKNKLNSGFTLVETLVAITIFTVSILTLMIVLGNGITDANYAKRKMTAEYLAQEGIEYIHNLRDTSAFSSTGGWANNFKSSLSRCILPNGCYFDEQNVLSFGHTMTALDFTSCSPSCPPLLYDSSKGRYGYGYPSGVDSGFVRKITVDDLEYLNQGDEVKVTSTVSWTQGSGTYSVSFSENLFKWIR